MSSLDTSIKNQVEVSTSEKDLKEYDVALQYLNKHHDLNINETSNVKYDIYLPRFFAS